MPFEYAEMTLDWVSPEAKVSFRHPETGNLVEMTTAELDQNPELRDFYLAKSLGEKPRVTKFRKGYIRNSKKQVLNTEGKLYTGKGDTIAYEEESRIGDLLIVVPAKKPTSKKTSSKNTSSKS